MATAVAVDGPISEAAGQYQCYKRVVATGHVEALAERVNGSGDHRDGTDHGQVDPSFGSDFVGQGHYTGSWSYDDKEREWKETESRGVADRYDGRSQG